MDNGAGALSFGVELAGGQRAFPTAPTWALYSGDDTKCMESVPLLLRRGIFCDTFFAHARVFRTYQSWVLVMMLRQARHPNPATSFHALPARPSLHSFSFGLRKASLSMGHPSDQGNRAMFAHSPHGL